LQTIAAFAIVMCFAACSKQETPIEILLFSDKITIMGNGEEAVKFTVTANNEDVTEESEIFMSEENSPAQGWTILGSRNFSSKNTGRNGTVTLLITRCNHSFSSLSPPFHCKQFYLQCKVKKQILPQSCKDL
jgi:hypothetical protein